MKQLFSSSLSRHFKGLTNNVIKIDAIFLLLTGHPDDALA
jgi:hypothetical protein